MKHITVSRTSVAFLARGCICASAALSLLTPYGSAVAQSPQVLVQVNTDANGNNIMGDAANEPSMAIDPTNPDNIVIAWREFPTINSDARYAGYAVSSDGGKTWTNLGQLDPPPGAGPNANQSDPVLGVDREGNFFYNSLIFNSNRDGMAVYKSATKGMSWDTPTYIVEGFSDKNWYNVDRVSADFENHYCIWGNSTIHLRRSTDGGSTWSDSSNLGNGISSYVGIGLNGKLLTAWWNNGDSPVKFRYSNDAFDPNQTPTFSGAVNLNFGSWPWLLPLNPDGGAGQVYAEMDQSSGPNRGDIYVLSSAVRDNDPCDVMFARSTDGGQSFSTPVRINDDPGHQDYQWMAAMSVSPAGRIDSIWFDTRNDPNHFLSQVFYTCSYDGGLTWSPNRAVSNQFDTSVGWPVQRKIGDYYQTVSDNASCAAVFPTTLNNEQDVYFTRIYPIVLAVPTLQSGQNASITVDDARPNQNVWLAYSLVGEGHTHINQLDVDLALQNPQLAAGPVRTDAQGHGVFNVRVPSAGQGRTIWLQALQQSNASQVEIQTIQ